MDEAKLRLPSFDKLPHAIAVDLDGTLLNSQARISERTYTAVTACIESEIPVVIATSRPARTLRRAIGEELAEKCSLIFMNGAFAAAAPPLSGFFRETIESSLAKEVIDLIINIEPKVRITIEVEGYWFSTNIPRDPDELWRINAATPEMQLPLDAALADKPAKIAVGGLNRDLSHVVFAEGNTFLNITSSKATKPHALKRLLDSRQISLDDVVAFGDDTPDLDMLTACGIPIAMTNSIPELKAVCRYQTASNDSDGVAIVLERILDVLNR
jgi:HAD superfamily hydrolase (TIGR01484 family)